MRRRASQRLAAVLIAVLLAAPAVPQTDPQADREAGSEAESSAAESSAEEAGGLTREERKARRKARKERKAAAETSATEDSEDAAEDSEDATEDSEDATAEDSEDAAEDSGTADDGDEAGVEGEADASPGDEERIESGEESEDSAEDDDSEADSDHPAQLVVSTDAPCFLWVDGESEGRLEPGDTLEVGVDLGEIEVRASAVEVTRATWEKTLDFEEEGQVESIRVRMKKAVRKLRQEERQSGVFRDRKTSLMWMKRDNGRDVDLREAFAFCRDLDYAGYDGWRLPTLEELSSLEAMWLRALYKIKGDIMLTECCMWSTDYDGSQRAWTYNFRFRKPFETNAGYELGLRALCVREWDAELEGDSDESDEPKKETPGDPDALIPDDSDGG